MANTRAEKINSVLMEICGGDMELFDQSAEESDAMPAAVAAPAAPASLQPTAGAASHAGTVAVASGAAALAATIEAAEWGQLTAEDGALTSDDVAWGALVGDVAAAELSTAEFVDAAGSVAAGSAASEAAVAAQSRRHIGMHFRDSLVVAARVVALGMPPCYDPDDDKPVWQSCAAPRSRSPAGKGRQGKVGKGGKGNVKNVMGDK